MGAEVEEETKFVGIHVTSKELDALVAQFGGEHQRDPEKLTPASRVALRIVTAAIVEAGTCMACGCTDEDCRECIAKTGVPWLAARR